MTMMRHESPAWINAVRLRRIEGQPLELTELDVEKYPALKEAFVKADEEHLRVSTQYPEMAYELIVKPSAVSVKPSEAKSVAELRYREVQ